MGVKQRARYKYAAELQDPNHDEVAKLLLRRANAALRHYEEQKVPVPVVAVNTVYHNGVRKLRDQQLLSLDGANILDCVDSDNLLTHCHSNADH